MLLVCHLFVFESYYLLKCVARTRAKERRIFGTMSLRNSNRCGKKSELNASK